MYGLIFLSLEDQRMRYWIRKYNSILKSKASFSEAKFSGPESETMYSKIRDQYQV